MKVVIYSVFALGVASKVFASCPVSPERSVMLEVSPWCQEMRDQMIELSDSALDWLAPQQDVEDYWEQWSLKSRDNPVVSSNVSESHFGLGFWLPDDYKDDVSDMSTEEWLRSHGLMFSFGFGEKRAGEPRMRFDYRWHDTLDGDVMMQVEVPF